MRASDDNRRDSTIRRDNYVLRIYRDVLIELGEFSGLVAKGYIRKDKRKNRLLYKDYSFYNQSCSQAIVIGRTKNENPVLILW